MNEAAREAEPVRQPTRVQLLAVTIELGLLALIVREFQLENSAFLSLFVLALIGFVIHANLPLRYRMPFFVVVSLAGLIVVLGPNTAVWLIALGLLLISICHLPLSFRLRIALLVVVGGLLVVMRTGLGNVPWSRAVWPILGSMFMFRMIIYLYDLRHGQIKPTVSSTLSYFFLLPNVVFPLFPVVDYRTFRRTYYKGDTHESYQTGIRWMLRGLVQLILYRFVYYYLTISPDSVQHAGDLAVFIVSNYMLYLRISGYFHLIVGMLRLFGFNLPETHHLYFLASSFTDYWRRINIYWKDFMMKIFYYPSYFRVRRLGNTMAIALATVVVFAATMLLHSYQSFWIRGVFSLPTQDVIFWSILALLVVVNALYESKKGRRRSLTGPSWTIAELPRVAAQTVGTFAAICILWSLWTAGSVREWIDMWSAARVLPADLEARRLASIAVVLVAASNAPELVGRRRRRNRPRSAGYVPSVVRTVALRMARIPRHAVTISLLLGILAAGEPRLNVFLGPRASSFIASLQRPETPEERAYLARALPFGLIPITESVLADSGDAADTSANAATGTSEPADPVAAASDAIPRRR